jgi:hypothetical protein
MSRPRCAISALRLKNRGWCKMQRIPVRIVITLAAIVTLILLASSLQKGIVAPSRTEATKSYYNLHFGHKPDDCPDQVARGREREALIRIC